MPLFSSLSLKDKEKDKEGSTHHNKLGKSQHARAASITTGRKGSIGGKNRGDEDASTRAMAGSQSRLQQDDANGTDYIKPMTPKSLNGDHLRNQSMDQMDMQDAPPPTPPPHEPGYIVPNGHTHDAHTRRESLDGNSVSTWRENPDVFAMRKRGAVNDTGTEVAGSARNFANPNDDAHVLSGDRANDLALARQKVQTAIEAELAADRAIEVAQKAVDEARMIVGALERQAHEEFERAHTRRMETAVVMKELEKLGRHNH